MGDKYTGVNDPKSSSLACVTQFVGIYEDLSKLDRPYCPKVRSPFLKLKYKLSYPII
ncbi:hypothetical protein IQ269_05545 [Tychonema sp. LEGE 07199]|uniref:hypothetical protein n=1 Tax=Microcoleaceae TaxID=1892252 RepID=UPI0018812F86|nr:MULTISPECIES: hypothetical protein [unclassified Tychonema]MBE9120287.1 hypothetical protein [Tychonema sp. LEGE 07199]MBE9131061.1 hypothetical protein [Tychonema sp. LEGE 07196]